MQLKTTMDQVCLSTTSSTALFINTQYCYTSEHRDQKDEVKWHHQKVQSTLNKSNSTAVEEDSSQFLKAECFHANHYHHRLLGRHLLQLQSDCNTLLFQVVIWKQPLWQKYENKLIKWRSCSSLICPWLTTTTTVTVTTAQSERRIWLMMSLLTSS